MKIEHLSKSFSDKVVIKDFSLDITDSSIVCLIGPSGCGKTTLLNIIAKTISADKGKVDYAGDVSYLFQEPRLLNWKTVLENVSLVIDDDNEKATNFLNTVGLGNDLDKYPLELSGGMRQRVAIARAFCFPSSLILMDEPFQNLDISLKSSLLKTFLDMWINNKRTVIWVTHDVQEACMVADKIVCLGKNGLEIKAQFENKTNQNERTISNTSGLYSQVLSSLIS